MSTRARISVSRSVVVASGRIHSNLCITPTASRDASPCRAGKIFAAARNTRRKNPPPSIARSLGLALSGSIAASSAPTTVPNLPRHSASWSSGASRSWASSSSSSSASDSKSETEAPSLNPRLRSSTHASYPAGSSARARARRSRRTLRMPPVAALSRVPTSRSTSSKSARRIPSHVGWLTSDSIGAFSPSSPSPLASSSSSSSSSSPAPPRVLKRSSSRGSLEDAATERLCTRSDASSRDPSSRLEGSEGAPSVEDADPARRRSWRRQASASALRCCSMTLQCLSRRCERCTSWGRVSRAKARSDAVSHRADPRCRAPPPTPSRSPPPPSSAGTASRSSISRDLAAASSSSVSSSPLSSSSSMSASPANRAVSSSAPDGAVAAAPSAPPSQSSWEADRPGSDAEVSRASAARSGSDDRATGNLKGLSNRLATQQYPSHAPMGAAR